MAYHFHYTPLQIGEMTLREVVGLSDRLSRQKILETGEKITLSGGDGSAYVDGLNSSQDTEPPEPEDQELLDQMHAFAMREAANG